MIIDFIIGVLLLGSLFHLSFSLWNIRVVSPFGASKQSNLAYGIFVLLISMGLFAYNYGLGALLQNGIYLGGLFAVFFTIGLGLLVNRRNSRR